MIIFCAAFVVSAFAASFRPLHILQLSSYQFPAYRKYFKQHAADFAAKYWLCFMIALSSFIKNDWYAWAATAAILIQGVLLFPRERAKKPLKLTARAIRILAAQLILLCGMGFLLYTRRGDRDIITIMAAVFYMLTPMVMVLSHFITLPLQKLINARYVADAKRVLRSMPDLKIIGVTGSYGKTTVKHILTRFLQTQYETLMTPESYNTPMGVVRTIREKLRPTHEVFVCEMGARHVGDIKEICEIVNPRYGVITSVGEAHLDTFYTRENIADTKFELAAYAETMFLCNDSDPVRTRKAKGVTYAIDHRADYRAGKIYADRRGLTFEITAPNGETAQITSALLGRHNVQNILGAAAAAHSMGVPLAQIAAAARNIPPIPHRLELAARPNYTLIDDAYNANPHGVKAALETLKLFGGTKILATPGMVEMGTEQAQLNREFGAAAAKICDHIILVGEKVTENIAEGIRGEGFANLHIIEDVRDAFKFAEELDAPDKVLLICNDLPDNYTS